MMDRATLGLIRYERRKRRAKWGRRLAILFIAVAAAAGIAYWGEKYVANIPWAKFRNLVHWRWQESLDPVDSSREYRSRSDASLHFSGPSPTNFRR